MPRLAIKTAVITFCLFYGALISAAQTRKVFPPYDLWTDDVLTSIQDQSTLDYSYNNLSGYAEVYFTSNPAASFFDAKEPYAEHVDEKIVIHGYIVSPSGTGPYPALVLAHDHGGHADIGLAQSLVTLFGVVVLAIDGPQVQQSTGGPVDDPQAWISVDQGAQYGYFYHYAYAGMRALTLLEALAGQEGNPMKIDTARLGALGIGMGGMITSYMNAFDTRMKAAIVVASTGSWQHALRINNSWFYQDIYFGTRDQPYNSSDPLNSIEDIDYDSTFISFLDHFDPIRYAGSQYAPVLTLIGTHDEYYPLPSANLMELALGSASLSAVYENHRLWLLPNTTHPMASDSSNLKSLAGGLKQWLNYCFGVRGRPLAAPQITLTELPGGMSFDVSISDTLTRLSGATISLYAATRVDSASATGPDIKDFTRYSVIQNGTSFSTSILAGTQSASGEEYTAQNIIYFATVTDALGLPVSSPVYKGNSPIDLSTGFVPSIEPSPYYSASAPVPPDPADAARAISSSIPLTTGYSYQGLALTNPTNNPMAVRLEARTADGRMAAAEGLINPALINIPPLTTDIFAAEQWLGSGARQLNGSLHAVWNDSHGTSLSFRGNDVPPQLDSIGPLSVAAKSLWLPLVPEQDTSVSRKLRFFSTFGSAAAVTVTYCTSTGVQLDQGQIIVPAWGSADLITTVGSQPSLKAVALIQASAPIYARMEVAPTRDLWSVEALPASSASKLIQPHAEWNGTYRTYFIVINTSSTASHRIWFTRRNHTGGQVGNSYYLDMPMNGTATVQLETVLHIPSSEPMGAGWIEADASGGEVIIQAFVVNPLSANRAAAVSALGSGQSGSLSMPYFIVRSDYWTGLAMANAGDVMANVSIAAYSEEGVFLGQHSISLGPKENNVQLVNQFIPELGADVQGHLIIHADAPVALIAYFGSSDTPNPLSVALIPFTQIVP